MRIVRACPRFASHGGGHLMSETLSMLPWFVSPIWALAVFSIFAVAFDFWLVRYRPLTSIGWKKVDYFWLSMAFVGILAAIANNRTEISRSLLSSSEARANDRLEWVYRATQDGANLTCLKLNRSQGSPPNFDEIQQRLDRQCEWFGRLSAALGPIAEREIRSLDATVLAGAVPFDGDRFLVSSLMDGIAGFNSAVVEVAELRESVALSPLESLLQLLGPILLSTALALRVTKVTGEIQLERNKAQSGAHQGPGNSALVDAGAEKAG